MNDLLIIIVWAAVFQGLFLGLLYIFSKEKNRLANKILGLFLLSFVLQACADILPYDYIGNYPLNNYFVLPELKLAFPILFLNYISEKLGRTEQYKFFFRIHYFLVGLILSITVINVLLFLLNGTSIDKFFSPLEIENFFLGFQYYSYLVTVYVFVISIIETKRYKKVVQNEFTDIAMLEINWLWQFIFILLPVIVLWGIEIGRILLGGKGSSEIVTVLWGFIAVFIYFISYNAFKNPNLFENIPETVMKEVGIESQKKSDNKVSPENKQKIITEMEMKTYYLNPDLTIHDFAKELQMSPRLISSFVNRYIGLNFNEWVNNYRVDNALKIMKSDEQNLFTIEGIGNDVGFKSRSAMYSAFKKKLGNSPGYYR